MDHEDATTGTTLRCRFRLRRELEMDAECSEAHAREVLADEHVGIEVGREPKQHMGESIAISGVAATREEERLP
jgi:hypothetical protein